MIENLFFITTSVLCVLLALESLFIIYRMKDVLKDLREIKFKNFQVLGVVVGLKIQADIQQINDIKNQISEAAEREDFETAAKLKEAVDSMARNLEREIAVFNKEYGDVVDINVCAVRRGKRDEG